MKHINEELVAGSSVSLPIVSPIGLEEPLMPGAKSGGKLGQLLPWYSPRVTGSAVQFNEWKSIMPWEPWGKSWGAGWWGMTTEGTVSDY